MAQLFDALCKFCKFFCKFGGYNAPSINTTGEKAMMTEDQLRSALHGRNLSMVSRDTGIGYDALYRFIGKPLPMFDMVQLSDYLEGLGHATTPSFDDAGTWGELAKAVEGGK